MNNRFSEELFLTNKTGSMLYHKYAENMPIIDYHCHLQPVEIAENKEFEDLGEMWLKGDHYKWRAMRTLGIHESFITGDASYHDKFLAFAAVLPELIGNPLYIWCALELKKMQKISIVRRNGSYRKSTLRGGGAWSIRMWNCYLLQRIRWMI